MRIITETEKKVVNKIIENYSNGQSIIFGKLLFKIFPIKYIEPSNQNDSFYKNTITICYNRSQTTDSLIFEAINLFDLLIRERYLVVKHFFSNKIIGENNRMMNLFNGKNDYCIVKLPNYYDYDLWTLLNSHYYVSNSLYDFAKDYKTIEQRHHEKEMKTAYGSLICSITAVIIAFISLIVSKYTPQDINPNQINSIMNDHIVEPLSVEIKDTVLCRQQ